MDKSSKSKKSGSGSSGSSSRRSSLPIPPQEPSTPQSSSSSATASASTTTTTINSQNTTTNNNSNSTENPQITDELKYLMGYKEREEKFTNLLKENCGENKIFETECENYLTPLINRTGPTITAALAAHGALDQLDKLHDLLQQLLSLRQQNSHMRRYVRDLATLTELKKLQNQNQNLAQTQNQVNFNIYNNQMWFIFLFLTFAFFSLSLIRLDTSNTS